MKDYMSYTKEDKIYQKVPILPHMSSTMSSFSKEYLKIVVYIRICSFANKQNSWYHSHIRPLSTKQHTEAN